VNPKKIPIQQNHPTPRTAVLAGLLLAIAISASVSAFQIDTWPYERLEDQADLIVIAEPKSAIDSGEIVHGALWQTDFIGVNTTFTVTGVIRGRYTQPELILHHLRLPEGIQLQNSPFLAKIKLTPILKTTPSGTKRSAQPEYLLFLKKRKDGRYEPVSGTLDSAHAIREIQLPLDSK
jgi:hypothetical protein